MFEKDAVEYREKGKNEGYYQVTQDMEQEALDYIIDESFKDGAEFGYDKAKEELKEENRLLGERCNQLLKDKGDLTDKVKHFELENAELKTDYDVLSCSVGDFGELQDKLEEQQRKNNGLSDNLTKAKELLKRCYENYIYLEPLRSEINQFLEEIEK